MSWSRFVWYIRQLLPLHYRTTYIAEGERHFAVWRMWFGRVFAYDDVVVKRRYRGERLRLRDSG